MREAYIKFKDYMKNKENNSIIDGMRLLVVSNEFTRNKRIANPIVERIINSTRDDSRIESVSFVPFQNKISDLFKIRKQFASGSVDILHIQFGGLYALIIWLFLIGINKPTIITFHGTDLHAGELATTKSKIARLRIRLNRWASIISFHVFDRIGVVSDSLLDSVPKKVLSRYKNKVFVQQLGVDFSLFKEQKCVDAQKTLGISTGRYFLFSDKSNTPIKRKDIAVKIIKNLNNEGIELLVMCGVEPNMVPFYLNASEAVLLISDMEGSPNIVREALALNKRVFSVNVGDVQEQIAGLKNSCIISRDPDEASEKIRQCLSLPYTDNTRETMRERLDLNVLTGRVVDIYVDLLKA